MIDELAQLRARRAQAAAIRAAAKPTQYLRATEDGIVELDLPELDRFVQWTPEQAETFAHQLLKLAKVARWIRKGPQK